VLQSGDGVKPNQGLIRVVQNNGLYTVEYTSGDVETNTPYSRTHPCTTCCMPWIW